MRRILQSIPLFLIISILLFLLLHAAPGGPLAPYLQDPRITQADIARLSHNFGLDRPLWVQYASWLGKTLSGNLGESTSNSQSVVDAMRDRIGPTLTLMTTSFVLSAVFGVTFGIIAALKPYSFWDYVVTTLAFFGQSMPVFWFGTIVQVLFAVKGYTGFGYHIALPTSDMYTDPNVFDLGDRIEHLILPAGVLCLLNLAVFSRFTRSSMLEVIRTDYIRTARAKGLASLRIVLRHALRNALIPVVTIAALILPSLVGGALVTERIFSWPGMGRLFFAALDHFDFELLMAYLLLNSILVVLFNLLADVAYAFLDPRVSYD